MNLRSILLALAVALTAAPALASDCPNLMATVDAALAESPGLDEDMKKEIMQLREEGEKHHAAGDHKKSMESLRQALLLLGKL